ncbi:hypothetical protein X801_07109, partial [Opisthorchis viverrini]
MQELFTMDQRFETDSFGECAKLSEMQSALWSLDIVGSITVIEWDLLSDSEEAQRCFAPLTRGGEKSHCPMELTLVGEETSVSELGVVGLVLVPTSCLSKPSDSFVLDDDMVSRVHCVFIAKRPWGYVWEAEDPTEQIRVTGLSQLLSNGLSSMQ